MEDVIEIPAEISFTKELGKATVAVAAVSAASVVGMYLGVLGVSSIVHWNERRKAKKAENLTK